MADRTEWSRRRFLTTTIAGAAGTALLGACSNMQKGASVDSKTQRSDANWNNSILLDPPLATPDVTLVDFNGDPYPLREKTAGRLTILGFGYTNCPDVCPVYMNILASTLRTLGNGPGSRPIVLFVGVDVARDTPERLRQFLAMDESFIGLTGDIEEMRKANSALYFPDFEIGEPDDNGDYLVGHDGRLTVFSPDDLAHRMYGPDTRQETWVRDLPRLDQGIYQ